MHMAKASLVVAEVHAICKNPVRIRPGSCTRSGFRAGARNEGSPSPDDQRGAELADNTPPRGRKGLLETSRACPPDDGDCSPGTHHGGVPCADSGGGAWAGRARDGLRSTHAPVPAVRPLFPRGGGGSQPTHRPVGCGRGCGDRSLGWVTQKPRQPARYRQKLTMRCHRSKPPARAGCTGYLRGL
jgi:hypothetical protein